MERSDAPRRVWIKPMPGHENRITPRIEWCIVDRPPLPLITPRIDFGERARQRALLAQGRAAAPEIVEVTRHGHPTPTPGQRVLAPVQATNCSRPERSSAEKIPKPPGEPGRPRSGGYALNKVLEDYGWETQDIKKFITDVHKEAAAKLNTSISYQGQNRHTVQEICTILSGPERWPVLKDYADCWPVIAILKLKLKYNAEASRRKNYQRTRAEERKEEEEVAALLLA